MSNSLLNDEDFRTLLLFFYWLKSARDAADTLVDTLEPINSLILSDKAIKQDLE